MAFTTGGSSAFQQRKLPTLLTPRLEWLAGDIQSVKAVLEKIVAVNDQLRGACVQVSADAQPGHMCRLPSISPLPQPVPHTHAAHRL
jgi:hypothetical protein